MSARQALNLKQPVGEALIKQEDEQTIFVTFRVYSLSFLIENLIERTLKHVRERNGDSSRMAAG